MTYQADQALPLWPIPPSWDDGVVERLSWLTDSLRARNGAAQKRQLRIRPRREFEFDVLASGQQRRLLDMLLNDNGSGYWWLPIWHDVQWIAPVEVGATRIDCQNTLGSDFTGDSLAILWLDANQWELVGISEAGPDHVITGLPITHSWPQGTRLYPVRAAHLVEQPSEAAWTDRLGKYRVSMLLDQPEDYPASWPTLQHYRGLPVLEWRPEESQERSAAFERDIDEIDVAVGPIHRYDRPGRAFRSSSLRWLAHGREEQQRLRAVLYALKGRAANVWLPSWNMDLLPAGTLSGTTLQVEWAGYTLFGRNQPNRRDLRIELYDGTVFYRRILGSAEAGDLEHLTLDAALPGSIAAHAVRQISFMQVCEQDSDTTELHHLTDAMGVTQLNTSFRAIRYE